MPIRLPRPLPAAAVVLALLATAGCGEDQAAKDRAAIERTVTAFGKAFAARDGQRICEDLLTAELRQKVEAVGLSCPEAIRTSAAAVRSPGLEVLGSGVDGDRGYVTVRSTAAGQEPSVDRITLGRSDGQWRITALNTGEELAPGRRPGASKPVTIDRTTTTTTTPTTPTTPTGTTTTP